ncbi:MAG: hypothetical protein H8D87_20270 [Deltaproteobacteria bacterium]|uniref:hypothetical protein n=1 Tax=Desulfobacula sp. TaxID=2593537 RepID=UPI0019AF9FD6|nr:hypothetical protein [Candidatus Desulfobacula maris]MBL6992292.1 hypothetical protein [Desulfobacula sp.]
MGKQKNQKPVRLNKTGTKVIYDPEFVSMAQVACENGFTDLKLANLFRVSKSLINNWKKDHPEFLAAIKAGKDTYDTENVETSLLKRALGYSYEETIKELDEDGEMEITKKIKKHMAGDVKAQQFWLRNRNRERWPDTKNLDGDLNVTLSHEELLEALE